MSGISHNQAIQLIDRRLDGLLNEKQLLALDEHLRSCDECNRHASEMELLPLHLRHEFHTRWDKKPGPSQNIIEYVTTKARNIPTANRFSSGMTLFAGAMMLIVLGITINFVISRWRGISPAALATESVNNPPLNKSGLIAFVSDQNGNLDIYTIRSDGSGLVNLTNHPANDYNPTWSPDGRRLAFVSNRDSNENIYVMNADGSQLIRLTDDPGSDTVPLWSPDGTRIAYTSRSADGKIADIYVMNINGQNHRRLTYNSPDPDAMWPEAWSSDGKYVFFYTNQQIVKINANTGEVTPVTHRKDVPYQFVLSKDDSKLLYLVGCGQNSAEFCNLAKTVQVDGTNEETNETVKLQQVCASQETPSTKIISHYYMVKWSPDRTKILFAFNCEEYGGLFYIANADGSDFKPLTSHPILFKGPAFDWSPDSQSIIFSSTLESSQDESLYLLNVNDALQNSDVRPIPLNTYVSQISSFAWQPDLIEDTVEAKPTPMVTPQPTIEADNKLLAFTFEQNGNFDIYTMRADGRALINVTNNPGSDTSPFWSPDGKRIAFESDRDGFTQIYLMNADGSNLLQLTKDKAHHDLPVDFDNKTNPWSPDGSKLLFLEQETGDEASKLYSMEIDSGNRTMLASGNIQSNNISWSPDGNYIGYVNNDSPTPRDTFDPGIYVVKPDGSNPRELKTLISQEERLNIPYYWSRAGHSIFFITQRHMDEGKDQWIAYEGNPDQNKLTQKATSSTPMIDWWEGTSFVTGFGVDSPFTWLRSDGTFSTFKPFEPCKTPDGVQHLNRRSSNGDLVMGVGCPNHEWWFYWSNPDGTVIKQLLDSPIRGVIHELGNIAWSSDDHYIAFTLASEKTTLYILNIEEALKDPSLQPEQVIIGRGDLYASPVWQPNP